MGIALSAAHRQFVLALSNRYMLIRLVIAIVIVVVFTSCDFISRQDSSSQSAPVLDTLIDYHTVDVYPVLRECNNCDTGDKLEVCFENEFVKSLEKIVNNNELEVKEKILDTVFVDILVGKNGELSVLKIYDNNLEKDQLYKFDSILKLGVSGLPKTIQPSLKRGIPVNSVFKLPVVVRSD